MCAAGGKDMTYELIQEPTVDEERLPQLRRTRRFCAGAETSLVRVRR
jgi:hypothetical protein